MLDPKEQDFEITYQGQEVAVDYDKGKSRTSKAVEQSAENQKPQKNRLLGFV